LDLSRYGAEYPKGDEARAIIKGEQFTHVSYSRPLSQRHQQALMPVILPDQSTLTTLKPMFREAIVFFQSTLMSSQI
jgi:hypothetical protein